jgi:adenylylsulfate kinase
MTQSAAPVPGTVYWITGLAGSGKTTLGRGLCEHLRSAGRTVVFLDGDVLRQVFGDDLGYSPEERLKSAMRNSRLCELLSSQGVDVVCATISMFRSCRDWNRRHIRRYVEIYVRAPIEVLIARDQKGLYSRALNGEINHVMGIDVPVEEPECPHLVVDNDGSLSADEVLRRMVLSIQKPNLSASQGEP